MFYAEQMPDLETTIRLMVIGQLLLIAFLFLCGKGLRQTRVIASLLLISIAAYLVNSSTELREAMGLFQTLVAFLAFTTVYLLWLFARAVFEAPWPNRWILVGIAGLASVSWAILLSGKPAGPVSLSIAANAHHVLALFVVFHALWLVVAGRGDDLIESRRRFRLIFTGVVAAQAVVILTIEILIGASMPVPWLRLANIVMIAGITLGLTILTLRLNPGFFGVEKQGQPSAGESALGDLDPALAVLREKLLGHMNEGAYRETGLTIQLLAEQLGHPEYRLRRLINGHLNFRNFSAFLNDYRVSEAKIRLSDPELVRRPVLNIAMDLGYASLGPFNRAFKDITGMTPTAFRRKHIKVSE